MGVYLYLTTTDSVVRQWSVSSADLWIEICSLENISANHLFYLCVYSKICANDELVVKKYACYENRNPEDQIENGKVMSSAQTLQNGCTTILTGKPPASIEEQEPRAVSIPDESLGQKLISLNQATGKKITFANLWFTFVDCH